MLEGLRENRAAFLLRVLAWRSGWSTKHAKCVRSISHMFWFWSRAREVRELQLQIGSSCDLQSFIFIHVDIFSDECFHVSATHSSSAIHTGMPLLLLQLLFRRCPLSRQERRERSKLSLVASRSTAKPFPLHCDLQTDPNVLPAMLSSSFKSSRPPSTERPLLICTLLRGRIYPKSLLPRLGASSSRPTLADNGLSIEAPYSERDGTA